MSVASEPIDRGRAGSLALRYALRELRGGLRGFYVFIACIALGVMAIAGVGSVSASFSDGLARGLVLVLAGVLLCGMTAIPQQPFWKDAILSPLAETAARTAKPYLPGEFARHVKF